MISSRRFAAGLLATSLFFSCLFLSSCLRVKPYERGTLSKSFMTKDKSAGESRFEQHVRGSREGADGGTGEAGGGCGCN